MSGPRVVLACKGYWPHVSESGRICEHLATALSRAGAEVRVLCAQHASGPLESYWDGPVQIHRLPHGPNPWWGPMRYWFALADWLKSRRGLYDVACVSGLQYDAYSASQALAGGDEPLVLRAEFAGPTGDCRWQAVARFGQRVRQRCRQAAAIVATAEPIADELLAAGYDAERIVVIENGVPEQPPVDEVSRLAARATLRDAHASLMAPARAPVALCGGPLFTSEQLPPLMAFWRRVLQCEGEARLWMLGSGRAYELIPRLAERQGLELSIAAPGLFDDPTEFYHAADLMFLPFDTGGQSLEALEAMSVGLPVVAADTPGNRALLGNGAWGTLIHLETPTAAADMADFLTGRKPLRESTAAARSAIAQRHTLGRMAAEHLELFERVLARR